MKQIHVEPLHVGIKPVLPDQVPDDDDLDEVDGGKATVPEEYIRSTSETPSPDTQDYVPSCEAKMKANMTPVAGGEEVTQEEETTCEVEEKAEGEAVVGRTGDGGSVATDIGFNKLKLIQKYFF